MRRPIQDILPFFVALVMFAASVPAASRQSGGANFPVGISWASRVTMNTWTQSMRDGIAASRERRFPEAENAFRRAATVCDVDAPEDIHQCLASLLLAEALLELGKKKEALSLTDKVIRWLKKAVLPVWKIHPVNEERLLRDVEANIYRFQVGAALYLRAARLYPRLNRRDRAEPLFDAAARIFEGPISPRRVFFQQPSGGSNPVSGELATGSQLYQGREWRMVEIREAQCRFYLFAGNPDKALESLRYAEDWRERGSRPSAVETALAEPEIRIDRFVTEPLKRSLLQRILDDCAFHGFEDGKIAVLLEQQALLLRRVERLEEAMAFERFAESLRKPRLVKP